MLDESLTDEVRVTVIATGLNAEHARSIHEDEEVGNIVDFKDSVDIERLIKDAAEEYEIDHDTNVVLPGKIHRVGKTNLDMPTFLRRQAD